MSKSTLLLVLEDVDWSAAYSVSLQQLLEAYHFSLPNTVLVSLNSQ